MRERQEIFAARDSAKANLDAKMNERRDLKSQTKFKVMALTPAPVPTPTSTLARPRHD